jgi:cysteine desulfurase/selenocysteine lyase
MITPARTPKPVFNVEAARSDFAILQRKIHGQPLIYFDNAASSQKPRQVIDAMRNFTEQHYANVHRGLHTLANEATEAYEEARKTVLRFINAPANGTAIFTRSATEAINLVAQSFGKLVIGKDDEIVLSVMEHHSNIVPWHFHRERHGAKLVWVDVRDDGSFDLEAFEKALTPRTKLVAMTHVSNVLGTIVPIAEVIKRAHARSIPVLIDGSQGAVHEPVDMQACDADFYAFTGHKLYGPTGIGILYAKREYLDRMRPYQGGGEMIDIVTKENVTYLEPPQKFEAGTPPIIQAVGLKHALDYVTSLGREDIAEHENNLLIYAQESLKRLKGVTIQGAAPQKAAIISFSVENVHAHDIATLLDRSAIAVRAGTHCAMPLLERFGQTSTCRVSFALYNTRAEVDVFIAALEKARNMFTRG